MNDNLIIVLVPIITGLVQVIKELIPEKKYIPLFSVMLGLGLMFSVAPLSYTLADKIIYGLMIGLSAVGFFEGIKHLDNRN
jgi:hypothetical protein